MKIYLLHIVFLLSINFGFSHQVNEAFFEFIQNKNSVEVYVEFPWTMRNALIEFEPSLSENATKNDFEQVFHRYIKENLILKDTNGKLLEFESFNELPRDSESHQNKYKLIYKGDSLSWIKNTVMFNLYDNQVNYNTYTLNSIDYTIETRLNTPVYYLKSRFNDWLIYAVIFGIPLLYLLNRKYGFLGTRNF